MLKLYLTCRLHTSEDHMPARNLQNKISNGSLSPGIIDLTGLLNVDSLFLHAYCKHYWKLIKSNTNINFISSVTVLFSSTTI